VDKIVTEFNRRQLLNGSQIKQKLLSSGRQTE
jgi:hypothetical protein